MKKIARNIPGMLRLDEKKYVGQTREAQRERTRKHRARVKAHQEAAFEAELEGREIPPLEPLKKVKVTTTKKDPSKNRYEPRRDIPTNLLVPICSYTEALDRFHKKVFSLRTFSRDDIDKVREMASHGMLQKNIAFYYGVEPTVWRQLKIMYPEITKAMLDGYKEHELRHLTNLNAISDRQEPGSTQAAIFKLKTSHGYSEIPDELAFNNHADEQENERIGKVIAEAIGRLIGGGEG